MAPSTEYTFCVFASPVGPYFKGLFNRVTTESLPDLSPFCYPRRQDKSHIITCINKHPQSGTKGYFICAIYVTLNPTSIAHENSPIGCGDVKAVGNYAPCFETQKAAKEAGFSDVLFLDPREEKYIEEAGSTNFFCVLKDKTLITPALQGSILHGVTRASIIHLMRERGYKVRKYRIMSIIFLEE